MGGGPHQVRGRPLQGGVGPHQVRGRPHRMDGGPLLVRGRSPLVEHKSHQVENEEYHLKGILVTGGLHLVRGSLHLQRGDRGVGQPASGAAGPGDRRGALPARQSCCTGSAAGSPSCKQHTHSLQV